MIMEPSRSGMGDWGCVAAPDYRINSAGLTIDCSCANNLLESACWGAGGPSTLPAGGTVNGPAPPLAPSSTLPSLATLTPWLILAGVGITALFFLKR